VRTFCKTVGRMEEALFVKYRFDAGGSRCRHRMQ
jgi:hypothetical protein